MLEVLSLSKARIKVQQNDGQRKDGTFSSGIGDRFRGAQILDQGVKVRNKQGRALTWRAKGFSASGGCADDANYHEKNYPESHPVGGNVSDRIGCRPWKRKRERRSNLP
jgi:hypothetical protein